MANTYFQFKQFTIQQADCAMKVCTDACLFGAWVAEQTANFSVKQVLDIGAGTGILSLMIAQKTNAIVHAIEIEPNAAKQCAENFAASPFYNRMHVTCCDANEFTPETLADLIVCNPPFFSGDLNSPVGANNLARHEAGLSLLALASACYRMTKENGLVAILLPCHRTEEMKSLMYAAHFHNQNEAMVLQSPAHKPFRRMLLFGKTAQSNAAKERILIKVESKDYSRRFKTLLQDYYLQL